MEGTFREWLNDRVGPVDGQVSQRELARRLGRGGMVDPENARRTIGRIARGEVKASQRMRDAIQEALEDWSAPSVDDEDEPITRELVAVRLAEMIERHTNDLRDLRRFRRAWAEGAV